MEQKKQISALVVSMKRRVWIWWFSGLCGLLTMPFVALAAEKTTANLCVMGMFCNFRSFDQLIKAIMRFLGFSILMASVLGIMIGGMFYIFSAGEEGQAEKGKGIIIASVIGLSIFFLSYAIVSLVQSLLYGVGI